MNTLIDIKYIVIDIDPAKLNTKLKTATLLGFKNLLKILAIMMFMIKHAHYFFSDIYETYRNEYDYITRV